MIMTQFQLSNNIRQKETRDSGGRVHGLRPLGVKHRYTIQVPRPLLAKADQIVGGIRLNQHINYDAESEYVHQTLRSFYNIKNN